MTKKTAKTSATPMGGEPTFANGPVRPYLLSRTSPPKIATNEYLALGALLLVGLYVRMQRLSHPDSVVFDEVHFGGFARKYILGSYFMDVHPPLAKMLFAGVGLVGGFQGDFEFKSIGDVFPALVPHVLMRAFPAALGVATVWLCYATLRHSGVRPSIALITALILLFENAHVTILRYILLDLPLIFFIAAAIYAYKKFEVQEPFTFAWYRSLFATGTALGLALSSKWVGLFTVAWVGLLCAYQCWVIIGDLTVSARRVTAHFAWRGAILLGLPALLYFAFFAVHFTVLANDGDGLAFMTPAFRAGLAGLTIPSDIPASVGLGSIVSIRHVETQGGYLHSHNHFYPGGSKQQQITLYPHLDANNDWLIEPYDGTVYNETFVQLTDGMKIRLKHVNTGRRLHSHDEKPPVSERDWQKEASCYGFEGFAGDANDDFVVEVVDYRTPARARTNVTALETIFRLRHAMTGMYLFSLEVKLPDWGFDQQEVTTASQGLRPLTHWYIETNRNPLHTAEDLENTISYPKLSVWDKFVESHKRMWKINQGLTEHHNWQSNPTDWPLLLRGINYWVKNNTQVYLMGNAIVWWAALAAIFAFGVHFVISVLRWQSGRSIAVDGHVFNFNQQVFSYALGWFLHYFPFFIMGRQLFLHHYLPAFYFGILALGHFMEVLVGYVMAHNGATVRFAYGVVFAFTAASVVFYQMYSPLIYAKPWTKSQCQAAKWVGSWDFDCNAFHDDYAAYDIAASAAAASETESPAPVWENREAKETPGAEVVVEEVVEEVLTEVGESSVRESVESVVPPFEDEGTMSRREVMN